MSLRTEMIDGGCVRYLLQKSLDDTILLADLRKQIFAFAATRDRS